SARIALLFLSVRLRQCRIPEGRPYGRRARGVDKRSISSSLPSQIGDASLTTDTWVTRRDCCSNMSDEIVFVSEKLPEVREEQIGRHGVDELENLTSACANGCAAACEEKLSNDAGKEEERNEEEENDDGSVAEGRQETEEPRLGGVAPSRRRLLTIPIISTPLWFAFDVLSSIKEH
ncbi:hypothetical protein DFH11DRAFT_1830366, partial [Phellopilus nigrolimitatus]